MFTIENDIKNELIINKSKFIACLYKVESKENILNILSELKKEYKDATHICYSYILDNEKRFNDDKEPGGTAGMPILNVLEKSDMNKILAVVVRYFGGIKLGAGGLLRAYSNSVSDALSKTKLVPILKEYKLRIQFVYNNVNNIDYILNGYNITYKEFDENIVYEFIYTEGNYPNELDKFIIKKESIN